MPTLTYRHLSSTASTNPTFKEKNSHPEQIWAARSIYDVRCRKVVLEAINDYARKQPNDAPKHRFKSAVDRKREQRNLEVILKGLNIKVPRPPTCERARLFDGATFNQETSYPPQTQFEGCFSASHSFSNNQGNDGDELAMSTRLQEPIPSRVNNTEPAIGSQQNDKSMESQTSEEPYEPFSDDATCRNASLVLLSPRKSKKLEDSEIGVIAQVDPSVSSLKESPVDHARRDHYSSSPSSSFDSPMVRSLSRQKRFASVSGKRGMDVSRMRSNDGSQISNDWSAEAASEYIDSPSPLPCASFGSLSENLSKGEIPLFSSSQSPILCEEPVGLSSPGVLPCRFNETRDHSFSRDPMNVNESVDTVDCTVLQKRRDRWDVDDGDSYCDEPNISLRNGSHFHLEPLKVRQYLKHRWTSQSDELLFPDPFSSYRGRVRSGLISIFQELSEREQAWDAGKNCAVVLSLSMKQIISMTQKILSIEKVGKEAMKGKRNSKAVTGGTLIVVRTKDDLRLWESALRERTSHSVVNFASIGAKERQRAATSGFCGGFDIVLTSFDALKSKDIATPLNELGYAMADKIGYENGWYSCRSGSSQSTQCQPFTVLHHIQWKRIIFVDTLGRTSYLSKPETARVRAGTAVNGHSRSIFFCNPPCDTDPMEEILKHDKKPLQGIASVLRLDHEQALDSIIDMKKINSFKSP